jgi:hypothetical protein
VSSLYLHRMDTLAQFKAALALDWDLDIDPEPPPRAYESCVDPYLIGTDPLPTTTLIILDGSSAAVGQEIEPPYTDWDSFPCHSRLSFSTRDTDRHVQNPWWPPKKRLSRRKKVYVWLCCSAGSRWIWIEVLTALQSLQDFGSNSFLEWPDGQRPLSTTMPWTIWPALVVLWGVCWMFYPSPRSPNRDDLVPLWDDNVADFELECEYRSP